MGLQLSRRLLRPIITGPTGPPTGIRSRLLGDVEDGPISGDVQPELEFIWRAAPPATVTIQDAGLVQYGPYTVVGTVAQVTDDLPNGVYTVSSQAQNSLGVLDSVDGTIEIIGVTGDPSELVGDLVGCTANGTAQLVGADQLAFTSTSFPSLGGAFDVIEYTLDFSDPGFPNDGRKIVVATIDHTTPVNVNSDDFGNPNARLDTPELTGTGASWNFFAGPENDVVLSEGGTITTTLRVIDDTGCDNTYVDLGTTPDNNLPTAPGVTNPTLDPTPVLDFVWQCGVPTEVELQNTVTLVTYGPYPVEPDGTVNVTDPLPPGTYVVSSLAEDSNCVDGPVTGELVILSTTDIYTNVAGHAYFNWQANSYIGVP